MSSLVYSKFLGKIHPIAEMLIAMTVRCGPVGASPEKSRVDQRAGTLLL